MSTMRLSAHRRFIPVHASLILFATCFYIYFTIYKRKHPLIFWSYMCPPPPPPSLLPYSLLMIQIILLAHLSCNGQSLTFKFISLLILYSVEDENIQGQLVSDLNNNDDKYWFYVFFNASNIIF